MTFYKCNHCGNIIEMINDTGIPVSCCGENMEKLEAGTTDGAYEKHVPVFTIDGDKIRVVVGATEHPMMEQHYIQWIEIETKLGSQRRMLRPDGSPKAEFKLADGDSLVAVYEYCNLHKLWKSEA